MVPRLCFTKVFSLKDQLDVDLAVKEGLSSVTDLLCDVTTLLSLCYAWGEGVKHSVVRAKHSIVRAKHSESKV